MAVMEVIEKTIVPKTGRVRLKMVETDIATSSKFLVVFPSGLSYKSLLPGNNFTDYILRELEADQKKDRDALEQNFYPKVDMLVNRFNSWGVPNLYHWRYTWNYVGWADKYKGQNQQNTVVDASKATYSPLLADIASSEVEIANFRNHGEDFFRGIILPNLQEWSRNRDYFSTFVETEFVFSNTDSYNYQGPFHAIVTDTHNLKSVLVSNPVSSKNCRLRFRDITKLIPLGETATLEIQYEDFFLYTFYYYFKNEPIIDKTPHSLAEGRLVVSCARGKNITKFDPSYKGYNKLASRPSVHFNYTTDPVVNPLRASWFNGKTLI